MTTATETTTKGKGRTRISGAVAGDATAKTDGVTAATMVPAFSRSEIRSASRQAGLCQVLKTEAILALRCLAKGPMDVRQIGEAIGGTIEVTGNILRSLARWKLARAPKPSRFPVYELTDEGRALTEYLARWR